MFAGYSGVEVRAGEVLGIYGVSPYIIIEYGSCRSANLAGLIGFFEDVIVPGDLGFLGLSDGLVVLAHFH